MLRQSVWVLLCEYELTDIMNRASNPNGLQQLSHKDFITTLDVLCEQFLRTATRSRHVVAVCNNILATIPTRQEGQQNEQDEGLWITNSERTTLQQYLQTLHTYTWTKMQQHMGTLLEPDRDYMLSCLYLNYAKCGIIVWTLLELLDDLWNQR